MKSTVGNSSSAVGKNSAWYWVPDGSECYVPGKVISEVEDASKIPVDAEKKSMLNMEIDKPNGDRETRLCSINKCFPILNHEIIDPNEASKISDLAKMLEVSTGSTLHVLRSRFHVDEIYTNMGQILIALNPFKAIEGMYTQQKMHDIYRTTGAEMESLEPHIYTTTNRALFGLKQGHNQVLIISGESGAGKTETTKRALEYIVDVTRERFSSTHRNIAAAEPTLDTMDLPSKILSSSPLLEALGNAKTIRNDNSSRFGKFMLVFFDKSYGVCGAWNEVYLLEKSRITQPEADERSYHVFYQLLYGYSEMEEQMFRFDGMRGGQDMKYLSHAGNGSCYLVAGREERLELAEVERSIKSLGFSAEERNGIFKVVAAVQHLGNIQINVSEDGERAMVVADDDEPLGDRLQRACSMLGVEAEDLCRALTTSMLKAGRRASVRVKELKKPEALDVRDALAKELYNALFLWTVERVNQQLLKVPRTEREIGILDIFGFEIFPINSFEQLCINLTNERLQNNFNRNVFQFEMDLYAREGIKVDSVKYMDNQPVIDLICTKQTGLLPLLDEEVRVPNGSDKNFQSKFLKSNPNNLFLRPARSYNGPFTILHFAGPVAYESSGLLAKNRNNFTDDMRSLLLASKNDFVRNLLDVQLSKQKTDEVGNSQNSQSSQSRMSQKPRRVIKKATVSSYFRETLDALLQKLDSSTPQYVRCIKSNSTKAMGIYEPQMVFEQLTYSGVFEAVVIQQQGYPIRLSHLEFRRRFHMLHGRTEGSLRGCGSSKTLDRSSSLSFSADLSQDCKTLLHDFLERWSDIDANTITIGKSLVLYKPAIFYRLEHDRLLIVGEAHKICQKLGRGGLARAMRRSVFSAVKAIGVTAQKGNIESIRKATAQMKAVADRWLKLYPNISAAEKAAVASQELLQYVQQEELVILKMKESIGKKASSEVLQTLVESLESHDELVVNVRFPLSGEVMLSGVRDTDLVKNTEERRDAVALALDIEEHFKVGFENADSLLLQKALDMLQSPALNIGAVVPEGFCRAEATRADIKIKTLKEEETHVLRKVQECLDRDRGAFKAVKQSITSVSSSELIAVLELIGTAKSGVASQYLRALKVLAQAREAVNGHRLDELKQLIENHWSVGRQAEERGSGAETVNAHTEIIEIKLPRIVTEMNIIINYMHIALVESGIKTALTAGALRGPVPIQIDQSSETSISTGAKGNRRRPSLIAASTTRPTDRVHKYLRDLQNSVAAFDQNNELVQRLPEEAQEWIDVAREVIAIRSAVLSKDWVTLEATIEVATHAAMCTTTEVEVKLAKEEVKYHSLLTAMTEAVVDKSRWAEGKDIGEVDAKSLGEEAEQVFIETSKYSHTSKEWIQASKILEATSRIRGIVRTRGWGEALGEVQSIFDSRVIQREPMKVLPQMSKIDEMALAARSEYLRVEDEAYEDILLASLREALRNDSMRGNIDATDDSRMSTEKLDACLDQVAQRQQKSKIGYNYVFVARLLKVARNHFANNSWQMLPSELNDSVLNHLSNISDDESEINQGKKEIELLVNEALHRINMLNLNVILSKGRVRGTPSRIDVSGTAEVLDQMRRTIESSKNDIQRRCGCKKNRTLLQICELIVEIRKNVVEDRWNPAFDRTYGCVNSKELISSVWRNTIAVDDSSEFSNTREPSSGVLRGVQSLILEFGNLSVTPSDTPHSAALFEEVSLLDAELKDRAFRISLTEAMARGRVRGSVEEVDYSIIDTAPLETALRAVEKFSDKASAIVKSLENSARVLLEARKAMLAHELVDFQAIKVAMESCYMSIGYNEMELILLESRNWHVLTTLHEILDTEVGRTSGQIASLQLPEAKAIETVKAVVADSEQYLPLGKMAERLLLAASGLIEIHLQLVNCIKSNFDGVTRRELSEKLNDMLNIVGFQPSDEISDFIILSREDRSYHVVETDSAGPNLDGVYEIEFAQDQLGIKFAHSPGELPVIESKPESMDLPRVGDAILSVNGEEIACEDTTVDPFIKMRDLLQDANRPVILSFMALTAMHSTEHSTLVTKGGDAAFNGGLNFLWEEMCLIKDEIQYRSLLYEFSKAVSLQSSAITGTPGKLSNIDSASSEDLRREIESVKESIQTLSLTVVPAELQHLMSSAEHVALLRDTVNLVAKMRKDGSSEENIKLHENEEFARLIHSKSLEAVHEAAQCEVALLLNHYKHEILRMDILRALARTSVPDTNIPESVVPDAQSILDLDQSIRRSKQLKHNFDFTENLSDTINAAQVIRALRYALQKDYFEPFVPSWSEASGELIRWVYNEGDETMAEQPKYTVQSAVRAALALKPSSLSLIQTEVAAVRDIIQRRVIECEVLRTLQEGDFSANFITGSHPDRSNVSSRLLTDALELAKNLPPPPFASQSIRPISSSKKRLSISERRLLQQEDAPGSNSIEHLIRSASRVNTLRKMYEKARDSEYKYGFEPLFGSLCTMFGVLDLPGLINALRAERNDYTNEPPHSRTEIEFSLMLNDICDSIVRERIISAAGSREGNEGPVGDFQLNTIPIGKLSMAMEAYGNLEAISPSTERAHELGLAMSQQYDLLRKKSWNDLRDTLPASIALCRSYDKQGDKSFEVAAIDQLLLGFLRLKDEAHYHYLVNAVETTLSSSTLELGQTWLLSRINTDVSFDEAVQQSIEYWQFQDTETQLLDDWAIAMHPRKFAAGLIALALSIRSMRSAAMDLKAVAATSWEDFHATTPTKDSYATYLRSNTAGSWLKPGQVINKLENQEDMWRLLEELESCTQNVENILRISGDLDNISPMIIEEVYRVRSAIEIRSYFLGVAEFLELQTDLDEGKSSIASFHNLMKFMENVSLKVQELTIHEKFADLVLLWRNTCEFVHNLRRHRVDGSLEVEYAEMQKAWNLELPRCTIPWLHTTMKEVDIMRLQVSFRALFESLHFPEVLGWSSVPSAPKVFAQSVRVSTFEEFSRSIEKDPLATSQAIAPYLFLLRGTLDLLHKMEKLVQVSKLPEDISLESTLESLRIECINMLDAFPATENFVTQLKNEYGLIQVEMTDRMTSIALANAIRTGAVQGTAGAVNMDLVNTTSISAVLLEYMSISAPLSATTKCLQKTAQIIFAMRQSFVANPMTPGKDLEAAVYAAKENEESNQPEIPFYFWPEASAEVQLCSNHKNFLVEHSKLMEVLGHGCCSFDLDQIKFDKLDAVIASMEEGPFTLADVSTQGLRIMELAKAMRQVRFEISQYRYSVTDRHDTAALRAGCDELWRLQTLERSEKDEKPFLVCVATQEVILNELRTAERFYKAHETGSQLISALESENPIFNDEHHPTVQRHTVDTSGLEEAHSALKDDITGDEAQMLNRCASTILDLRNILMTDDLSAADECLSHIEAQYSFPIEQSKEVQCWPFKAQQELISAVKSLFNHHAAEILESQIAARSLEKENGYLLLPDDEALKQITSAIDRAKAIPMHYRCERVENLRENAHIIRTAREAARKMEWRYVRETAAMTWYFAAHQPIHENVRRELMMLEEYAECKLLMERATIALQYGALTGNFKHLVYECIEFRHLVEVHLALKDKLKSLKVVRRDGILACEMKVLMETCSLCSALRQAAIRGGWITDSPYTETDHWFQNTEDCINLGWGGLQETRVVEEVLKEMLQNGGVQQYATVAKAELELAEQCLEQKLLIFHLRQELSVDGPEGDPGLFDPGTVSIEHLEEVLNLAAPQGLGKDVEALRRDAKIIIRLRQATMASDWELLHRLVEAVEAYLKDPVRNFKALEYFEDTHEGIETEALHNLYAVQDSAALIQSSYEVNYTEDELHLTFQHDEGDYLPVIKSNNNDAMLLPEVGDEVIAVNGKSIKGEEHPMTTMAQLIQTSGRPVTLSFQRHLYHMPQQHSDVVSVKVGISSIKEIEHYRDFLNYSKMVHDFYGALCLDGSANFDAENIHSEHLLKALIEGLLLKSTSPEIRKVQHAIKIMIRFRNLLRLGDIQSALGIVDEIEAGIHKKAGAGIFTPSYILFAQRELRSVRGKYRLERTNSELSELFERGQILGVAGSVDVSYIDLRYMTEVIERANPGRWEQVHKVAMDESSLQLLRIIEILFRVRKGMLNEDWTLIESALKDYTMEGVGRPKNPHAARMEAEAELARLELYRVQALKLLQESFQGGAPRDVLNLLPKGRSSTILTTPLVSIDEVEYSPTESEEEFDKIEEEFENNLEKITGDLDRELDGRNEMAENEIPFASDINDRRQSTILRLERSEKPLGVENINIHLLKKALQFVRDKHCLSADVQHFYNIAKHLKMLRSEVKESQWLRVKETLEKFKAIQNLPAVVAKEIRLVKAALDYRTTITEMTRAIEHGMAVGEVGELNIMTIELDELNRCIRFAKSHFVNHPDVQNLNATACLIRDLRVAMKKSRWYSNFEYQKYIQEASKMVRMSTRTEASEIIDKTSRRLVQARQSLNVLQQTDETVMSCIERGKRLTMPSGAVYELKVAEQELKDKIIRLELISGLSEPEFHTEDLTPDRDTFDNDYNLSIAESDVERLKQKIETAHILVPSTLGSRKLLATARVLLPMRQAFVLRDWDALNEALLKAAEQCCDISSAYGAKELRFYESQNLRKRMLNQDLIEEIRAGQLKWDINTKDIDLTDIRQNVQALKTKLRRFNRRTLEHDDEIYFLANNILKLRQALMTGAWDDVEWLLGHLLPNQSFAKVDYVVNEVLVVRRAAFIHTALEMLSKAVRINRIGSHSSEVIFSVEVLDAAIAFVQQPPAPYTAIQHQRLTLNDVSSQFRLLYISALLIRRLRQAILDDAWAVDKVFSRTTTLTPEDLAGESSVFASCVADMNIAGELQQSLHDKGKYDEMALEATSTRVFLRSGTEDIISARHSARRASIAMSKSVQGSMIGVVPDEMLQSTGAGAVFGPEHKILKGTCQSVADVLSIVSSMEEVDKRCTNEVQLVQSEFVNRIAALWLDKAVRYGASIFMETDKLTMEVQRVHTGEHLIELEVQEALDALPAIVYQEFEDKGNQQASVKHSESHERGQNELDKVLFGVESILNAELKGPSRTLKSKDKNEERSVQFSAEFLPNEVDKINQMMSNLNGGNFIVNEDITDQIAAAKILSKLRCAILSADWHAAAQCMRDLSIFEKRGNLSSYMMAELRAVRAFQECYDLMDRLQEALKDALSIVMGQSSAVNNLEMLMVTAKAYIEGQDDKAKIDIKLRSLLECAAFVNRIRVAASINNFRDLCQLFDEVSTNTALKASKHVCALGSIEKEKIIAMCLERMLTIAASHQAFAMAELRLAFEVMESLSPEILDYPHIKRLQKATEMLRTGCVNCDDSVSQKNILKALEGQTASRMVEGKMLGDRLLVCLKKVHEVLMTSYRSTSEVRGAENENGEESDFTRSMAKLRDVVATSTVGHADPDVYPSVLLLLSRAILLFPSNGAPLPHIIGVSIGKVTQNSITVDWLSTGIVLQKLVSCLQKVVDTSDQYRRFYELANAVDDFAKHHAGDGKKQHERRVRNIRAIVVDAMQQQQQQQQRQ